MNCPACGLRLEMGEVQELPDFVLVRRFCTFCRVTWVLKHQDDLLVSITQEGIIMENYGFDYKCPHCQHEGHVATVLQPKNTWRCIRCGKIVPNINLTPRGEFMLPVVQSTTRGSSRSSRRSREPGYQRTPRTSKPVPTGAVGVAAIAQDLNVEPKKLRSWLRKVKWRTGEEAGSQWLFSPAEAEEVKSHFRR